MKKKKEEAGWVNISFKAPAGCPWLPGVAKLAAQDHVSESEIYRLASEEYVARHLPGNWQLILPNFMPKPEALSIAAQEKLNGEAPPGGQRKLKCQRCEGHGVQKDGGRCEECGGFGYYYWSPHP